MKKTLLVLSVIISLATLMAFSGGKENVHNVGGAPAGVAGDPAASGATCTNCHSGPTAATIAGIISSNIPGSGYVAGNTYTVTANFVRAGHLRFGFQITPQNPSGTQLGTMANISGTQLVGIGKYITHLASSTSGSGSKIWDFQWTAPATGQGPVTFYGAFNAANNNGGTSGDSIFKSTLLVTENTIGVFDNPKNNLSVSTFPNPTADKLNINFTLQKSSSVEMDLLDIRGNKITNLLSETDMSGEVKKTFDVSSYVTGIYFLRLNVNGNSSLQKIVKM